MGSLLMILTICMLFIAYFRNLLAQTEKTQKEKYQEELLALQHNVGLGNIIHDQNGISLRIVTDKPHYSYIPVKDNISLEDVYLYYFEYLK